MFSSQALSKAALALILSHSILFANSTQNNKVNPQKVSESSTQGEFLSYTFENLEENEESEPSEESYAISPPKRHVQLEGTETTELPRNKDKKKSRAFIHFASNRGFQPPKSVFFQANVGAGFLYFAGVKGNLMGKPTYYFLPASSARDVPLKGRFIYNKTPLFEYVLGYQLNHVFSAGLSYQHQGGITIETKNLHSFPPAAQSNSDYYKFTSNLSLDGLLAKAYCQFPFSFVIKNLSMNLYLAAGVGVGWQSWLGPYLTNLQGNQTNLERVLNLRQKISANAIWMLDFGCRLRRAEINKTFSMVLGCKYNQWGQARSIGKMSQQDSLSRGLADPLRIKMVYQFSPYLGVQWNYAPTCEDKKNFKLRGLKPNTWLPFWACSKSLDIQRGILTQFNAGIGFLYFSGIKGNFAPDPGIDFQNNALRDVPIKRKLTYNRTPLFEYLIGYKFKPWMCLGLSYQYQSGVLVRTKYLHGFGNSATSAPYAQFQSNLDLNGILTKVYLELPLTLIFNSLSIHPYLAVGIGAGWQTWRRSQLLNLYSLTFTDALLPLRQKISANAIWMTDIGMRAQSAYPGSRFSVFLGCKYNQWGQARSIGKMSQQWWPKRGLDHPFRIKMVYQFAPYLGVQWNFNPNRESYENYKLRGHSPNTWLLYWVKTNCFQARKCLWTQYNVGMSFLYFSGLQGNLMGKPAFIFYGAQAQMRDVPLKGKLSYNRSPLFDFQVGYQFTNWIKVALCYQYQGNTSVQTQNLPTFPRPVDLSFASNASAQFSSNLSLNGILTKFIFELPNTAICKNLSFTPYLASGIGIGWQTWSSTIVSFSSQFVTVQYVQENFPLRQKISANVIWMLDLGFRIQSAYPNSRFSVLLGCKYNQWGQARSMGKMSQQGSQKWALGHPVHIKMVYQFAPYLGVQWNF